MYGMFSHFAAKTAAAAQSAKAPSFCLNKYRPKK